MALKITEECIGCWACETVCPEQAIIVATPHFRIDPKRCTECDGHHAHSQCTQICPSELAIVAADGTPFYTPGELTGIPPAWRDGIAATLG